MSAMDDYWAAAMGWNLPASVPVFRDGEDEVVGLATSVFNLNAADVRNLALSTDHQQRGLAAVYACRTVYKAVENITVT